MPFINLKYIDGILAWPSSNITATPSSTVECCRFGTTGFAQWSCDDYGHILCRACEFLRPTILRDYYCTD